MTRSVLWLSAVSAVVLLSSGCNCNNVAFVEDGGTGGSAAGGGVGTGGGQEGVGGGQQGSGGGLSTGGSGATGGGSGAMGGGSDATGGGSGATGGGSGATGGGSGATGGGSGAMGGGSGAMGGGSGAMGGGSAAGCAGQPAGTYVCQTCSNAADTNTGTQNCPLLTINKGMQNAVALTSPTVFIATQVNGGTTAAYVEDITVPLAVTLQGKWTVAGNAGSYTWTRASASTFRTAIQNAQPEGLRFATGATASAGIDGLTLNAARVTNPVAVEFGVYVLDASPTLIDFDVRGVPSGGAIPQTDIGIWVQGSIAGRPPTPVIGSAVPAAAASAISGIHGTAAAEGLHVEQGKATITNVRITEVSSSGTSVGTHFVGSPGTTFTNGQSNVLSGVLCFGILSTGDATGTDINNVGAQGCISAGGSASPAEISVGVDFDQCVTTGNGASPTFRRSPGVTGGVVSAQLDGGAGIAAGIIASDGCALDINNNTAILGAATGSAVNVGAYGIVCTYQGLLNNNGADAPCQITNNAGITGSQAAVTASAGIACTGSCASKTASCAGSCTMISDNKPAAQVANPVGVSGGAGAAQYGLYVTSSNPTVVRNSFAPTSQSACSLSWGGWLSGAGGYYADNLFAGQNCSSSGTSSAIGLELQAGERAQDNSVPSPTLYSNTIASFVAGGLSLGGPTLQAGVRLSPIVGSGKSALVGTFLNNIFQVGPTGTGASYAFQETAANVDPKAVQYNDYVVISGVIGVFPSPLYLDEGTTTLGTTAQIDALVDTTATNSQAVSPGFAAIPHLSVSSALRSKGTLTGVQNPQTDYDGDARSRADGGVDIGADQLVP